MSTFHFRLDLKNLVSRIHRIDRITCRWYLLNPYWWTRLSYSLWPSVLSDRWVKNHADSQILVISQNDRFVSKVDEGELFYLNNAIKELGRLDPHLMSDYHKVKKGLAGIIEELSGTDVRPIILTEGKSDKQILDTGWEKLNPEQSIPFKIISSGIQIDEDRRTGSAETVRRSLEYLSANTDRKIIGLFDNDREGEWTI